ncbi:M1 family metallopeptidase [Paenibacillus terrigena]|uniref:M1 family metallopeptidase n=1 Tax=Paenibacillus terrigena TaxID=369333 RepID=UPI0003751958|nr:M1 family metallopeptidase [Paenibacillus terrigena]
MNRTTRMKISKRMLACSMIFTLAVCPILSTGTAMAEPATSRADQSVDKAAVQSPIQYQIDVRLDEKNMTLHGNQTVVFRNTSKDTLKELVFHTFADANRAKDTQPSMFEHTNAELQKNEPNRKPEDFLGGIDITKVQSNGQVLPFNNKNQALTATLGQALKPDESVTIQIAFDVKIPYGSQRLSYYKNIINGAHWFPVMSVYDENKHEWDRTPYSTSFESDYYTSSDFKVNMNVPASYQVSMPGTITEHESTEAGRKIVSTVSNNTRELVFFASPDFKVASETRDGLTVQYYYFDNMKGKKEIIDQYIDQAFKAIQFFSDKFGKYPYPEFRIVESYVEGVAVEFARVIQMGMIQNKKDASQDTVFVHEIAHQWFHALIGNNSETESFLDEGFADFAKVYFSEKQGDTLSGFNSIRMDIEPIDLSIASSNTEVADMANPVYYGKGSQAIYQLYRMVGEEKFDPFMKEYFKRYIYQNATIDGLLQTIEDTLGKVVRYDMEKALRQPNFVLKPEYQMTEDEQTAYMHEQFKSIYDGIFTQYPILPEETMSRIIHKALLGEPLTIVLSDPLSSTAKTQQEQLVERLKMTFTIMGIHADVMTDRPTIKAKLEKELAKSNIIVIGDAKSNALLQAMKRGIMKRTEAIGYPWKDMMNKKDASGAYVIKHPYNQKRLMVNFFMTDKQEMEPYMIKASEALNFSSHFYQFYSMNAAGKVTTDKKIENPMAKLFEQQ